MGFYDGHHSDRRGPSTFVVAIVSAIIGGLIVGVILAPIFLMRDTFSGRNEDTNFSVNKGPTITTNVKVNSNITQAVHKVQKAVVGVINLKTSEDPFHAEEEKQGTGSGIIFQKKDGKAYVVTNNHVIAGSNALQVVIPYKNGSKTVGAKLLGADPVTDLAVLEITDKYVTDVAEFGNSDQLQSGEPAIAIGNPLGLQSSVTVGVISSPKRSIDVTDYMATDVIQTDAAINPGNSGGALVNTAGQVIGINSLKIAESGVEGLGFAIPINDAIPIIQNLINTGTVPRAYLGVTLLDLSELSEEVLSDTLQLPASVTGGVVIRDVSSNTPAARAGLQPRDVIVKLDNQAVNSRSQLRSYIYRHKKPGSTATVTFYRNGQLKTTTIKFTQAPASITS